MIIPKEEIEKAAEEYCNTPDRTELEKQQSYRSFLDGVKFSEEYTQKHIQDILIENQGLKLYKDNESKRFRKLAINFAYYCLMHDWLQNGFRCGGLSTEEIYDKFINDPDEANS